MSEASNDTWLGGWTDVIGRVGASRTEAIKQWNEQNKPIHECVEDECTMGLFTSGCRYYFGEKLKNGYDPNRMVSVPAAFIGFIKRHNP